MSDLSVIYGKEAVGNICNLLKRFLPPSDFKEILIINEEIAFERMLDIIIHLQLTTEQRLSLY